jgi:hypothetical protein
MVERCPSRHQQNCAKDRNADRIGILQLREAKQNFAAAKFSALYGALAGDAGWAR